MDEKMTPDPTVIPDCKQAIRAWRYAYEKIVADGVFQRAVGKLAAQITELFEAGASGPFTFDTMRGMPRRVQEFYSGLIDAQEALAELLEDRMSDRVMQRHPVMMLVGEALGVLADERVRAWVGGCPCPACRNAVSRATPR